MGRLKLYKHDLQGLADALASFENKPGAVRINTFRYHNLVITVDYTENQMDGASIYITGIEDASTHN